MFEVEIKSLLGSKESADALKSRLARKFSDLKEIGRGKQLNHYFNLPKDLKPLEERLAKLVPADKQKALETILLHGSKISLRTRDADGTVILVLKASVGGDTSSNGVKRMEFEAVMPMKLAELDQVLLDNGCSYQAKWSREREEYAAGDMHVCIDKNAGYGYLAEFEKVIRDEKGLEEAREGLLSVMGELGVAELPQDRLERMFAHYNSHWPEYYGTERTFTIE